MAIEEWLKGLEAPAACELSEGIWTGDVCELVEGIGGVAVCELSEGIWTGDDGCVVVEDSVAVR